MRKIKKYTYYDKMMESLKNHELSKSDKKQISKVVDQVFKEYGSVIRRLGDK